MAGKKGSLLHAKIQPSLAILKYSGTLLVCFKDGKYVPRGRLYLLLIVGIMLLSDYNTLVKVVKTIISTWNDFFSAKQFVVISAKIMYQIEFFYECFFVAFRTGKLADLLNGFVKIDQLMSIKYSSKTYFLMVAFLGSLIVGNLIYTYLVIDYKKMSILAAVILEIFNLSMTFQVLFFVHLTTAINKQLNQVLESEKYFNFAHIVNLRNVREMLTDLYDKIQDTFGFAILMSIFVRALFFIHDVNITVAICLSFSYNRTKFTEVIYTFVYSVVWLFLDLFLIISAVMVCSKAEFEVSNDEIYLSYANLILDAEFQFTSN